MELGTRHLDSFFSSLGPVTLSLSYCFFIEPTSFATVVKDRFLS